MTLGGLVAFITQAGQLSICGRDMASTYKRFCISEIIIILVGSFNCCVHVAVENVDHGKRMKREEK